MAVVLMLRLGAITLQSFLICGWQVTFIKGIVSQGVCWAPVHESVSIFNGSTIDLLTEGTKPRWLSLDISRKMAV